MNSRPKLSITIVHHHGLEMLRNCLESIQKNPPDCAYEVILVDNVSVDGAIEMVTEQFPSVKIITNETRHGFGFNQNTGIKASVGDYIFVLNDDTLILPNTLDLLCDFLDGNPQVGLVGPRLLNRDHTLQMSCYKFPSPIRCIYENFLLTAAFPNSTIFGDYRKWAHDETRSVDFVIGAAMLVRRTVVEQVGYFDLLFFMYSEETDWQMRMRKEGWEIMFFPGAQVVHLGGASSEGMKDKQFVEFNSSAGKFIHKHFGLFGSTVHRAAMLFGSVLRIAVWSILWILPSKRAVARRCVREWLKLFRWWAGLGPHEGLSSHVSTNAQYHSEKKS